MVAPESRREAVRQIRKSYGDATRGSPRSAKTGAMDMMLRRWLVGLTLLAAVALPIVGLLQPAAGGVASSERTYTVLKPACTISDKRLGAISGMATRSDGTWVINDRGAVLYRLGSDCKVAQAVDLAPQLKKLRLSLTDVEDLAVGPGGWLWLSDSGGNNAPRGAVRLVGWRDATTPIRTVVLRYATGKHDAEALLIDMVGRAILVTKVPAARGPAQVYQTRLPLGAAPVQNLRLVGALELERIKGSAPGSRLITAGSVDPTGTYVVLRTYTNAWEFDAPDGDIAVAIVSATPRLVPLPTAKQGEAIAYNLDGSELLATGEGSPVALDRVQITRSGG
jgi:hypothetical protein